jgi:7,8-dihydropterin-6-yl-methyl-4-(beta-D-ribofuranosyl)aminobenzene 5'-phosphate synthase
MDHHISPRALLISFLVFAGLGAAETPNRVTILYDSFGKNPALTMAWGFAALIEYGGKRILFDAGGDPDILARNAAVENIDLSKLDFVVMSHRHGDHMGGLAYVLKVNPRVKIYAPKERSGVYGDDQPAAPGIARTHLYPRNSVITAARRPRSYTWERPGPVPTFS